MYLIDELKKYIVSLSVSWSVEDKRDLLLALETHGPNNLEEIHKYLPEKSIMEIRFTIEKYKKLGFSRAKAFDSCKLEESSLNQWIKLLKRLSVNTQGVDDLVPRILKYIAYFEDHTSGAGINLRECYLALSELCRGEAIKILDPYTAHFLYGCLTQLAEAVKTQNNEAMINFIKNIEEFEEIHRSQLVKSYSKKKVGSFDINPLNVPPELLKMKDEFSQQE
ncbi:hypothetical protein WA026_005698 [Henosepilachna vigintioctopunctata]|uniref:Uncharacterized protein n=1 Tax=Henosepilachna vigintioctopunctata TaxID=420089 RepID=A0AAW1TTJ1_9CUCU